jgi:hypothetical protein
MFRICATLAALTLCLPLSQLPANDNASAKLSEARLLEDLKFLAGDQCEGRGIRTEGINLAADHLVTELKKAGLKSGVPDGSFFQPFSMNTGVTLGQGNQFVLHGPSGQRIELQMGRDFNIIALGGTGKVKAPIVFAGYGVTSIDPQYDDYKNLDVAGKVVIVIRKLPRNESKDAPLFKGGSDNQHASLQRKAANAELHKAVAIIFINDNLEAAQKQDPLIDFSYTAMSGESVKLPAVHLRRKVANTLVRGETLTDISELERNIDRTLQPASLALNGWVAEIETNLKRQTTTVKNVIGVLEGSGPLANETVVIGAHYDHLGYGERGSLAGNQFKPKSIHYGADDNGSGTVMVLELARRFGAMKERVGRRLVFMHFTAEESGLIGSAHYCKTPIFPLKDTVAMVNMDMVGRLKDEALTVYGTGTAKTFDGLIEEINKKHNFKLKKVPTGFGPSDQSSFYAKDIPVFHFFTGLHQQYHRPSDTVDTINFDGMVRITGIVQEVCQHLMTVDRRPEYVKVAGGVSSGGPRMGPTLGIRPGYDNTKEGVLVEDVVKDRPAEKGGLKAGDLIVQINGKPVKQIEGYMAIMGGLKKGEKIEVVVNRGGKEVKLPVVLE